MTTSENKTIRKPRITYKTKLAEHKELYSDLIDSLGSSLKNRLNNYFDALNGTYSYTDSHSGRTVQARTYKKRLKFAEQEIKYIQSSIHLQTRYGKLSESDSIALSRYTKDIYNLAIRDNQYTIKNRKKDTASAKRLRRNISSIDNKLYDSKSISAPTGFTNLFKDKEKTIPIAAFIEPEKIEVRGTSSPLYRRLKAIGAFRPPIPFGQREQPPRADISIYSDTDDPKVPKGDLSAWPYSPKRELRLKNKLKGKNLTSRLGNIFKIAVAGALLFLSSDSYVKNAVVYSPDPQVNEIKAARREILSALDTIVVPAPIQQTPSTNQEVITNTLAEPDYMKEVQERVEKMKKQIELEKSQMRSTPPKKSYVPSEQQKSNLSQLILESPRREFDWRESLDQSWQRKSDERNNKLAVQTDR